MKEKLAAQGVAPIYANDNYGVWQSDFHSLVSTCLGMEGEPGEIAKLLYPQAEDITILKPRHSAFFGTLKLRDAVEAEVEITREPG